VYNSEASLSLLVQRLEAVLNAIAYEYEIIFINDGSRDKSWDIIVNLAETNKHIRGINLMRNYGQHNALLCGVREAQHEFVVTMDDDLQNPPEEIPKLIAKLIEGYDVVYGVPETEQHGIWRDLASKITKIAMKEALGAEVARNISAFRVFRIKVRSAFEYYRSPYVSLDVLLTWATTRFAAIKVKHEQRQVGMSNYGFRKLVNHALTMMTGFSILPLQIASLMGFGFALFGMGVLFYILARYFFHGGSVPGFPFLASIIALFAGAQLFALGIIGEYIARMHFRMMERPPYTIREKTKDMHDKDECKNV
jgi:undecaprenyl-phosphate 4-deoxy-4-formamido-L-arabinose transferase